MKGTGCGGGKLYSRIEKLNSSVYISVLCITDFIESEMKGIVPENYLTGRGIDLSAFLPAMEYCTADEISRVAGARSLKRQIEWLCGRIALKELLYAKKFPGKDFRDIIIGYDESGKPVVSQHEDTGISLTHSGDFAIAALHLTPGKKTGIDLEKSSGIDLQAVMSVAFTPEERTEFKNRPAKDIITVFTFKEAFLKITGKGFHETINRVTVDGNRILFDKTEVQGITAETRSFGSEYILSIIYES